MTSALGDLFGPRLVVLWAWLCGTALAALVLPHTLSADMAWHLQWGVELDAIDLPTYGVGLPGPTPHPGGLVLAALAAATGHAHGYEVLAIAGPLCFAGVVAMTVRLGWVSFGLLGGAIAGVFVALTASMMEFTLTFFVDSAYVVLLLMAVTLIAVAPERGVGPLALFAVAGLLRPEAWLFSAVYWLYLVIRGPLGPRLIWLALLGASGALAWTLWDLIVTGDPLYSLTYTQAGARRLDRVTGLANVPRSLTDYVRMGVRPGIMIAATVAFVLIVLLRRGRVAAVAGFTAVAGLTYVVLGAAHVSLLGRYTVSFQIGITLLFAWLVSAWARAPARRTAWVAVAVVASAAALVSLPGRLRSIDRSLTATDIRQTAVNDLDDLAQDPSFERLGRVCRPRGVVDALAEPFLEYFSDVPPGSYSFERFATQRSGIVVTTQNADVLGSFSLTAPDDTRAPPGFRRVRANASWEAAVKDC
jgi:hypothetical protein